MITVTSQGRSSSPTPHSFAHISCYSNKTSALQHGAIRRQQLTKQRIVARGMLSRIQNFIAAGDQNINEIQVRFNKLPDIFNRYDTAQGALELSDDTGTLVTENYLKISTVKLKLSSVNFYIP